MDYPHGHGFDRRHDGRGRDEERDRNPRPPYGQEEPPQEFFPPEGRHEPHHQREGGGYVYPPPPGSQYGYNEGGRPAQVYHTSHGGGPDSYGPPSHASAAEHRHHPHMPHFASSEDRHSARRDDELSEKRSVRVYCKAETNFSLTVRDGNVVLVRSDPSDPCQHWIKDEKFSTKVKDEEGFPSFSLINKATGQALKHAIAATQPVQLTPYNGNALDESILWTESRDLGDGYRTIRMVSNIRLNVDAFNGDANHGGVHDGTTIVLWEWKKGDNQRWNIVPY